MVKPRHLLPAALAALAIAGCGGGSGESSTSTGAQPSPSGKSAAVEPETHRPQDQRSKPAKQKKAKRPNQAPKPSKSKQDQVAEIIRKSGGKGVSVKADSPVAKKILQALNQSKGKKHGKKGATPLEQAVEELASPGGENPQGGSGGIQHQGGAVAKVVEQLQQK